MFGEGSLNEIFTGPDLANLSAIGVENLPLSLTGLGCSVLLEVL